MTEERLVLPRAQIAREGIDFKRVWKNLWSDEIFYLVLVAVVSICQSSSNCNFLTRNLYFNITN